MKLSPTLLNKAWLPALLSAVLLLGGYEATQAKSAPGKVAHSSRNIRGVERPVAEPHSNLTLADDHSGLVYENHLVRVEKTYKSGSVVGAPLNYDIIITAKRNIANVQLEEHLPDTIKYQTASPIAVMNESGMPTWTFDVLESESQTTINVTVVPQEIGDYKVCSSIKADPLVCLPLYVGQPQLVITKTGPAQTEINEIATWNVVVQNTGTALASNVVITDLMPTNFTSAEPLSKTVGDLEPGETATFIVTGTGSQLGQFVNTATANFEGGTPVQTTAPIEIVHSAVAITKTGSASAKIFSKQTYTITVLNEGNTTLNNLVVTDLLPEGVILQDRVAQSGQVASLRKGRTIFINPKYDAARGVYGYWREGADSPFTDDYADQVTWTIDSLEPGASKSFQVSFYANKPMTTVNKATVTTGSGLSEEASASTVWKASPGVHTGIRDSIDPIAIGQDTVLTLYAQNQSGQDTFAATSQVITVGEGLTVKSASSDGSINGNTVTFPSVTLGPGEQVTRNITVTGSKPGIVTTKMETSLDFRQSPLIDEESTTVY